MKRPKVLDLFCCEGGASEGYHRAGFDVYGIDLFEDYSQKRYQHPSFKGDAIQAMTRLLDGESLRFVRSDKAEEVALSGFAVWVASPPCQAYSVTKHSNNIKHPDLIGPVRSLLSDTGLPYVIENVLGAPLIAPLTLCGTEFNLVAKDVDGQMLHLKRHRLFESNKSIVGNGGCRCAEFKNNGFIVGGAYGGGTQNRAASSVLRGGYTPSKAIRAALIGIDWMTQRGLSQAIPPAYTEHIGRQLLDYLS